MPKAKTSQAKPRQAKPSQAKPSQAKTSQAKPRQAKPSQAETLPSSWNLALSKAKKTKQDEFYTQLGDIEIELKYYKAQLRGKTILCNCDDPFESNFFRYFALNFNTFGIKKLIATSYVKSPITGGQLPLLDIEVEVDPLSRTPYCSCRRSPK